MSSLAVFRRPSPPSGSRYGCELFSRSGGEDDAIDIGEVHHSQEDDSQLVHRDVNACVRFWVDRLQFEKTIEVPDGENLAFAALQKGPIELMYGSYASLEKDPAVAQAFQRGTSLLFLEVDDIEAAFAATEGAPVVSPMHATFYGTKEFTVKDPAGHLITFAQFEEDEQRAGV
jgi:uncharacterized glyoxalase superfamily protein PhnB